MTEVSYTHTHAQPNTHTHTHISIHISTQEQELAIFQNISLPKVYLTVYTRVQERETKKGKRQQTITPIEKGSKQPPATDKDGKKSTQKLDSSSHLQLHARRFH